MYQTSREFRLQARTIMRKRLVALMLTAAVFLIADYLVGFISNELTGINAWNREFNRRMSTYILQIDELTDYDQLRGAMEELISAMPDVSHFTRGGFALALSWLISLMSVPLAAGYTYHIIQESRGVATSVSSVLYGFRVTFKTIGLNIAVGFMTLLGFMLFIVPGIILTYRYSMALYILMDDPSKGVIQCMKESGAIMSGQKWRFFKLQFSFIGWYIVSALVTGLIGLPVFDIWLMPYTYLARAGFYNQLVRPQTYYTTEAWNGTQM